MALKQAKSAEFKDYQKQVLLNAKQMEHDFKKRGYDMVSGGTDTHLLLLDLRNKKVDGARVERVLELANIAANKNTIPSDKSAMVPHGIRLGSPAMTSRGLVEADFSRIVDFIDESIQLTAEFSAQVKSTKFKDFKEALGQEGNDQVKALKAKVVEFSRQFPCIGFDPAKMKYRS